jgi:hypothetical protein
MNLAVIPVKYSDEENLTMLPSTSWSGRFSIFEFRNLCAIAEVNPYGLRRILGRYGAPSERRVRSNTVDVRRPSIRNTRVLSQVMLAET